MTKVILDKENTKQKIQTHWDNNVCGFNKGENFNEIDNWALKAHPYHPEEFGAVTTEAYPMFSDFIEKRLFTSLKRIRNLEMPRI